MKHTYFFRHDYHARHDPKLEHLRMEVGPVSDGIFWDLVEMMYEQGGYLQMADIPLYAKILNTNEQMLNKVVNKMFTIDRERFYSESLISRLTHINKVREERRFAGISSGKARQTNICSTNVEHLSNNKDKKRRDKIRVLSPQEFILSLKTKPEYKHIAIDTELLKMDSWLERNPGRRKTPRFILNWLNKIEAPIETPKKKERGDV